MHPPVRFGLIGCGGMGRRRVAGYAELVRSGLANVELAAVCDLDEAAADDLADEARALTGVRPRVFQAIATMCEAVDGLAAVDVVTDIRAHHRVAIECVDRGLAVQVEKPLALTMRACNLLIRAARRAGRPLIVAESHRRDPVNRLVRALIDDGAIGEPQMMLEATVRGRDRIVLSPWRHDRLAGGALLDLGIGSATMMRYYLGEAESAAGVSRLLQPVRRRVEESANGSMSRWSSGQPETVRATADDALWGLVRFRNGAVAQWSFDLAGQGLPLRQRVVYGSAGSILVPGDGLGRSPRLDRPDRAAISDDALLEFAPSYRLCGPAAALFGAERPTSYRFSTSEVDRKLIALQYHEMGTCVLENAAPEISAEDGRRDAALLYAVCESSRTGRFVDLDDVEEVRVDGYQRDADADLGLIELAGFD